MKKLDFTFGKYENVDGYWAEVSSILFVVSGGHFNSMKDVYKFYLRSKQYYGEQLNKRKSIDFKIGG